MTDSLTIDTGATAKVAAGLLEVADTLSDPSGLITDVANTVGRVAQGRVPRATGALANSFGLDRGIVEGNPAAVLTWGARYAVYVNFGTRHMPARPFATDALEVATKDADRMLTAWAEQTIGGI